MRGRICEMRRSSQQLQRFRHRQQISATGRRDSTFRQRLDLDNEVGELVGLIAASEGLSNSLWGMAGVSNRLKLFQ
jgi:hypothetical protein